MFTMIPGPGPVFRSGLSNIQAPLNFDIVVQEEQYIKVPAGVQPGGTFNDVIYEEITGDVRVNKYDISLVQTGGELQDLLTAEIEVFGAGELVNGAADFKYKGYGIIRATHPLLTKEIEVGFNSTTSFPSTRVVDYVAGSLAKSMVDSLWPRAEGKNATHLPVFSTNYPNYVRNTNCWVHGIDWTGVSPWNSYAGARRAGVAISPRHIAFAWHYQLPVGATVHFVTADNQVVSRTITAKASMAFDYVSDTTIGLLDSDLPASIKFYKVFPATLQDYFGSLPNYPFVPVVGFDQQEKALMKRLTQFTLNQSYPEQGFYHPITQNDTRYPLLTETIISGDSGNPVFAVVDDEPVLLTMWTTPQTGPSIHNNIDEINALMTSLGGGYQLTQFDLSGFTNYG